MVKNLPFDQYVASYEAWFDDYPYVFETELAAIRKIWPPGHDLASLEIATGTGRFAKALGIREGIEISPNMAAVAEARGVNTFLGMAEDLPYLNGQFDVVLMNFCICYFRYPRKAMKEAFRVVRNGGSLIVGFIDRDSRIGKSYEERKATSIFYKDARFYTVAEVEKLLRWAGFDDLTIIQTLFNDLEKTNSVEPSKEGFGEGSYVLIRGVKPADAISKKAD